MTEITDQELEQQIVGIMMDCEHDSQLMFQWCLDEVCYWTQNLGKIKVYKQPDQLWVTEIFENQTKLIQCKSSNKNASLIGASLLLANLKKVEIPVEHLSESI